MGKGVHRR